MSQQKLLTQAIRALESAGIEYMLTGSFVSSLHGEPRATHDVDLILRIGSSSRSIRAISEMIAAAFPTNDYYWSEDAIRHAVSSLQMFNVLEIETGDKIDFWMLTHDAFDQRRFSRRYASAVLGMQLPVSTPEDTILQKLKWSKESGGSEKHMVDAISVYEVQYDALDHAYLSAWVNQLDVAREFNELLRRADTSHP